MECVYFIIIVVSVYTYIIAGHRPSPLFFFFISFSIFYFSTILHSGETSSARARDAWPRLIPHCLHTHTHAVTTVRAADVAALKTRQFATAATAKCLCRRRDEQCDAHSSRCTDYYYLYYIHIYKCVVIYSSFYYFFFFLLAYID